MTVLRFLSTVGLGAVLGAMVWVMLSIPFFSLLSFGGGFPPGPQPNQLGEFLKIGLVIGAIHGTLVSVGIVIDSDGSSSWQRILVGFVVSEIALVLALAYAFYSQQLGFKVSTVSDTIQAAMIYFLVFSAILVIPTLLIGLVVARTSTFASGE